MAIARNSLTSRRSSGVRCAISRMGCSLRRRVAGPLKIALRCTTACGEADDMDAVRDGFLECRIRAHARQDVLGLMRDSFDAIRFVFAGIDQPQVAQAKVLHAAN